MNLGQEIFTTIMLIIGCSVILLSIIMVPFVIKKEKKGFNNGFCPICGEKLEQFDIDSHGSRGYCCRNPKHHYYTWVSYNCVDKNFKKSI